MQRATARKLTSPLTRIRHGYPLTVKETLRRYMPTLRLASAKLLTQLVELCERRSL